MKRTKPRRLVLDKTTIAHLTVELARVAGGIPKSMCRYPQCATIVETGCPVTIDCP